MSAHAAIIKSVTGASQHDDRCCSTRPPLSLSHSGVAHLN